MPSLGKKPPCKTSAKERLLFFVALKALLNLGIHGISLKKLILERIAKRHFVAKEHVGNHLDMTVMSNAPQTQLSDRSGIEAFFTP